MSYSIKEIISVLLLDKADAYELLNKYRNRLIKVVKAVDMLIINIKVVIKYYKIKLVGISLYRYLLYEGIELF